MSFTESRSITQNIGLIAGPVVFLLVWTLGIFPENWAANKMAAAALLMAVWWMTEAMPLGATSILPVVLFPLIGVLSVKETANVYFSSTIFIFIGGFFVAIAMEKWNLHKRIALMIIRRVGGGQSGMIFGFMLACMLLSMFVTNTATTIMMLPIAIAIIIKLEESYSKKEVHKFSVGLLLGIAYASSIGGIATLVGTVPNLVFREVFQMTFPAGPKITFANWMLMAFPIALIMMLITWFMISKVFFRSKTKMEIDKNIVEEEYKALGKADYEEKMVFFVLVLTSLLWIFRKDIEFDLPFMDETTILHGWSSLLPFGKLIDDGTVAAFGALLLFILPAKKTKKSKTLLASKDFPRIPWEIIILFGGGFALAKGFTTTGLSHEVGAFFHQFDGAPVLVLIIASCFALTFLTELTSNTATTQTLLPILASIAVAMEINPLLIMVPATMSASFAFMLPVATPPNAIVFGSERIRIAEMARTGFFINIIGVIIVSILFYVIGQNIFGIDIQSFPEWAKIIE
jgi:solute carrier family 13 (sodium-dependent dicarboxylate transporter), member 2/3/5